MTLYVPALVLVLLLWFAGLLAAMQFAKIAVPFAEVIALYSNVEGRHGWLLSLVSLVGALLGIVAGSLVGRIGARVMLLGGLVTGGLISLWQWTELGFDAMLVSRVFEGASHLAIVVAAPTLIVAVAPGRWRGAAMALWSTFFGIGFALLALVAPALLASGGLKLLFGAHGVAMLALCVPLAFALRRLAIPAAASTTTPSLPAQFVARPSDPSSRTAAALRSHVQAYSSPFVAAPAVGWLFYTLTFVSLLAILPGLLPPVTGRVVATAMPLVSVAVSLVLVPLLLRRQAATRVVVLGFTLAIGTLCLPLLGIGLATVAVILFAALGLVQGASFAAVPELNDEPASQGLAYGAMAQTGNIGNLLGTPLLLALLPHGGFPIIFASVAALYLAAIAAHAWLDARRKTASAW